MDLRIFGIVVLLLMVSMPVSAEIINFTVLTGGTFEKVEYDSGIVNSYDLDTTNLNAFGGSTGTGGGGAGGRSGDYSSDSVYTGSSEVIAEQVIKYYEENSKLYFTIYRSDASTLSGYILLQPSAALTGVRTVYITEYDYTNTNTYYRDPTGYFIVASDIYMAAIVDTCSDNRQYFMMNSQNGGAVMGQMDNATITALPISGMTYNPMYRTLYFTESSDKTFRVISQLLSTTAYTNALAAMTCNTLSVTGSWSDTIWWLLGPLQGTITQLSQLGSSAASLLTVANALAGFIFSATLFVGISAFYTAIAIILCLENGDDMFQTFGCFIKREQKLFRFYMELFRAVKDIIKWW